MRVEGIAQRDGAATASRTSCLATGYSEGFRPTDAGALQQETSATLFIYVQEISGSVELYIIVTYLTGAVLAAIATKWNHTANQALNSSHEDGIHLFQGHPSGLGVHCTGCKDTVREYSKSLTEIY